MLGNEAGVSAKHVCYEHLSGVCKKEMRVSVNAIIKVALVSRAVLLGGTRSYQLGSEGREVGCLVGTRSPCLAPSLQKTCPSGLRRRRCFPLAAEPPLRCSSAAGFQK